MNHLKVIDDVVSPSYQDHIERIIGGESFPWYYYNNITEDRDPQKDNNGGFSNRIYHGPNDYTPHAEITFPLLLEAVEKYKKRSFNDLIRIRAAMFTKNQTDRPHLPHVDHQELEHKVMLYYVVDSDGPTKIYNGDKIVKEIVPKKGRAVFFPGNTYHASSSPKQHPRRIVINFNYV